MFMYLFQYFICDIVIINGFKTGSMIDCLRMGLSEASFNQGWDEEHCQLCTRSTSWDGRQGLCCFTQDFHLGSMMNFVLLCLRIGYTETSFNQGWDEELCQLYIRLASLLFLKLSSMDASCMLLIFNNLVLARPSAPQQLHCRCLHK